MTYLSHILLALALCAMLAFICYDRFFLPARRGPSVLVVPLARRGRIDYFFFIAMMIYLIIVRHRAPHPTLAAIELGSMIALLLYLGCIRRPKLFFKPHGFFLGGVFIARERVKNLKLTEQGVLLVQLETRQVPVHVQHLDDLEKIYHQLSDAAGEKKQASKRQTPQPAS